MNSLSMVADRQKSIINRKSRNNIQQQLVCTTNNMILV